MGTGSRSHAPSRRAVDKTTKGRTANAGKSEKRKKKKVQGRMSAAMYITIRPSPHITRLMFIPGLFSEKWLQKTGTCPRITGL